MNKEMMEKLIRLYKKLHDGITNKSSKKNDSKKEK